MVLTWWLAGLALVVLFTPIVVFLVRGWRSRREELLGYFTDEAIRLYFERFYSAALPEKSTEAAAFARHHDAHFGRHHFVLPLLVLAGVASIALAWCADSFAQAAGDKSYFWRPLSPIPVAALLGAYAWVVFELISESVRRTLSPSNILWAIFRFAVAAPIAMAVTSLFQDVLGVALAFLLGGFPTQQLMVLLRRLANQKLGLGDQPEGRVSEIQVLDSVDRRTAERLAEENITAIVQLAYCNPVEISIRTSIRLDVIADYVGQALVWNYLGEDTPKLRRLGIRGAPEVADLWRELNDEEPDGRVLKQNAEKTVDFAATALKLDPGAFRNTIAQVAEDPYTVFLCSIWGLDGKAESSDPEQSGVND